MPYPRYKQVNVSQTPYYHLISKCVRRAFLCGFDKETGESYEHRKDWVEKRLIKLSQAFNIGILAYAVMSNHTHLVVAIKTDESDSMSDMEVIKRWHTISKGSAESKELMRTGLFPEDKFNAEKLRAYIQLIRKRLVDISWLMKLLNEYIARRANKEDQCTGHFWEGRFKSFALLDMAAVISCMVYVDLNPFRAGIVTKPELAEFNSLCHRIRTMKQGRQPKFLVPFGGEKEALDTTNINFSLVDYIKLIDEAARCSKKENQQYLLDDNIPIFERLNVDFIQWLDTINNVEKLFPIAFGDAELLNDYKTATGRIRMRGAENSLKLYRSLGLKTH